MKTNNQIVELLTAPLEAGWNVEGLAEQLLSVVAAQRSNDVQEFVLDENATTNRQVRRLIRPLLACLATRSAAESGTPVELFGGDLSFKRSSPTGTMWILGHFENQPGSVRIALHCSNSPAPTVNGKVANVNASC